MHSDVFSANSAPVHTEAITYSKWPFRRIDLRMERTDRNGVRNKNGGTMRCCWRLVLLPAGECESVSNGHTRTATLLRHMGERGERLPKGKTINIFPINCLILSPESTRKCFLRPSVRSLASLVFSYKMHRIMCAAICARGVLVSLNCFFSSCVLCYSVSGIDSAIFVVACLLNEHTCLSVPETDGRYRSTLHICVPLQRFLHHERRSIRVDK